MKKYITATIGSAIIVPGFGQVLNGQIKKGLILMGVTFVIFIAGVIKLIQVIMPLLPINPDEINWGNILAQAEDIHSRINITDISTLRMIIFFLIIIWIYSIIDAFIIGVKIEKERKGN